MSELRAKQERFAQLFGRLLLYVPQHPGYTVVLGETWRSEYEALRLAKAGLGIKRSLHCDKLAADIDLFRRDPKTGLVTWLQQSEEYRWLGEWWQTQDPLCRWGGNFPRTSPQNSGPGSDARHFSLAHEGRA